MKKDNYYICKIFLFFIFLSFSNQAQNTVIKHYGVNQGLPSSECYWVMQDSKGYVWVATDAGVVKYDGYKFRTYNSSKGLPDNTVFKIHEDKYGKIWFATYSGQMAYYSYDTDSIYGIKANKALTELIKVVPLDFTFDDNNTLFISASRHGYLKVVPPLYNVIKEYNDGNNYLFLREVGEKNFIYGSSYDFKNQSRAPVPVYFGDKRGKESIHTLKLSGDIASTSAIKTSSGDYLLSNFKSISMISDKGQKIIFDTLPFKNGGIITIYQDQQNRIWINTHNSGTFIYDTLSVKVLPKHFLENMSVTSVCQDSDKGIWLTTLEDGLYYIPSLEFRFIRSSSGLPYDKIYSIDISGNKLSWLSSDCYFIQSDIKSEEVLTKFPTIVSSGYLLRSGNELLICSTMSFFFDESTKQRIPLFERRIGEKEKIGVRLKKAIDFDQKYVVGYFDGTVMKIDKASGESKRILTDLSIIFSVYKQDNVLWIGTKKGLYSFCNNELKYYGDIIPVFKNRVECMVHDGNKLFLGIRGYGIFLFENNKILSQYSENNGLVSDLCKSIIKDSLGNIWVGTNRGISRLKKESDYGYSVNTINLTNGMVSSEINQLLVHYNKLYFATNKGIGMVKISDAFNPLISIPVYIENVFVNNKKIDFLKKNDFKHDENFISINYKGVCVKSEGDVNYKYRLEGLDTNWTYTKNTYVQYTTLPHGDYKFTVYAINQDGKLSEQPQTISFTIQKPFWKTFWFYFIMAGAVLLIIYFIYTSRVQLIKRQEKEKTEINRKVLESELKALRAQMNPHFMFNAINSIQNFVLKNDSRSAQKYLTKFARLIRSVLENSKHELVWLRKEVEALELYIELEALRSSFSFDHEISMDDSLNADNLFIPPMIIQPYIENAILHGLTPLTDRRGRLTVKFYQDGSVLKCVIDDNGIGRAKAEEIKLKKKLSHQSMGMSVTQDRINILNTHNHNFLTRVIVSDKTEDHIPMGTTVEIIINLKNSQND